MRARAWAVVLLMSWLASCAVAETVPSSAPPAPPDPSRKTEAAASTPPLGGTLPVPLDQPGVVSMAIKDANVMVVIETIVINGRYSFAAQGHVPETVSVNFRDLSIAQALDAVTSGTGIEYRTGDGIAVLYGRDANPSYVEVYRLQHAKVDEPGGVYEMVKAMLRPAPAQVPGAAPDDRTEFVVAARERNRLIVRARPSIHRAIERLLIELDSPPEEKATRGR